MPKIVLEDSDSDEDNEIVIRRRRKTKSLPKEEQEPKPSSPINIPKKKDVLPVIEEEVEALAEQKRYSQKDILRAYGL